MEPIVLATNCKCCPNVSYTLNDDEMTIINEFYKIIAIDQKFQNMILSMIQYVKDDIWKSHKFPEKALFEEKELVIPLVLTELSESDMSVLEHFDNIVKIITELRTREHENYLICTLDSLPSMRNFIIEKLSEICQTN